MSEGVHFVVYRFLDLRNFVIRNESEISKATLIQVASARAHASQRPYVFSLPALGALRNVELYGLPFLKTLEPARLDCREMHKNILTALTADEAVAFGVVEPLHCSLFCHIDVRVPLIDLRWRDSEVLEAGYWLVGRELLTTDSV